MSTATKDVPAVLAVLADESRWSILTEIGSEDLSASALAQRLPISRQAIAKHLTMLSDAGLVESFTLGREIRYRALGARLSMLANELESIGREWDRRLAAIKRIAAGLIAARAEGDRSARRSETFPSCLAHDRPSWQGSVPALFGWLTSASHRRLRRPP